MSKLLENHFFFFTSLGNHKIENNSHFVFENGILLFCVGLAKFHIIPLSVDMINIENISRVKTILPSAFCECQQYNNNEKKFKFHQVYT